METYGKMINLSPLTAIGSFLIGLAVYVLIYLTVTESFLGTLFPTGLTAIVIGALGIKLLKVRRKQKSEATATA